MIVDHLLIDLGRERKVTENQDSPSYELAHVGLLLRMQLLYGVRRAIVIREPKCAHDDVSDHLVSLDHQAIGDVLV